MHLSDILDFNLFTENAMKTVIAETYRPFEQFIKSIPSLFRRDEGKVIYDKRNQIRRFEHKGLVFVAKRYKRVNFIQQIVYTFFRKTKGERAFRFPELYRQRGVSTPREVAFIECYELGLFTVCYFVSEEVTRREVFQELVDVKDFDHELARAVVRQIVYMHSKGILHGDLNLSNFLYEKSPDGKYHFTLIDINRSHFTDGWPSDEDCMKDLVRLVHRRDLYTFLISRYAELRGWPVETTVSAALKRLDKFEHRIFK